MEVQVLDAKFPIQPNQETPSKNEDRETEVKDVLRVHLTTTLWAHRGLILLWHLPLYHCDQSRALSDFKKKKNPQRDKLALFLLHKTVELWLTYNSLVIGTSSPDGRNNSFSSPREPGFELPGECHTKAKLDLGPTVSLMGPENQPGPENARTQRAASRSSGNPHAWPQGLLN